MYHYRLSPDQIWGMTEEQREMLMYGLVWLGKIKIKSSAEEDTMKGWDHLRRLMA